MMMLKLMKMRQQKKAEKQLDNVYMVIHQKQITNS